MSDFSLYFQLGVDHISDLGAYDHMLFIVSLCALFTLMDWRKVVVLVTAFTLGHSITLALSVMELVSINKDLVERLIPITILITCAANIYFIWRKKMVEHMWLHYFFAAFFGLIHGLGFANYLKVMLMGLQSLVVPLLSFNLGIEIGQVLILLAYFGLYFLCSKLLNFSHGKWAIAVSILIGLESLRMIFWA